MMGGSILIVFLFVILPQSTGGTFLPTFPCKNQYNPKAGDHDNVISPTWIDTAKNKAGIFQTPNFPNHFPLPLRCVWIFNNTRAVGEPLKYLHFYFTQFFLAKGFVTFYEISHSEWINLRTKQLLSWHDIKLVARNNSSDFARDRGTKSSNPFIMIAVDIKNRTFDFLHNRAFDVRDSYGFNITYESDHSNLTRPSCSLENCYYNGECLSVADAKGNLSGFQCKCTSSKSVQAGKETFTGDHCQYLKTGYCTEFEDRKGGYCKNGGKCVQVTSRYKDCDCKGTGYKGTTCKIKIVPSCKHRQAQWNLTFNTISETFHQLKTMTKREREEYGNLKFYRNNSFIILESDRCLDNDDNLRMLNSFVEGKTNQAASLMRLYKNVLVRVMSNDKPDIEEGRQFQITCIAEGFKNPVFRFWNGKYYINDALANRHMKLSRRPDINGMVLLLTQVDEFDNGDFTCQVFEIGDDPVPSTEKDLKSYPSVFSRNSWTARVITKPRVSVFPMSLTVVKDEFNSEKDVLSCFANHKAVLGNTRFYVFHWERNGKLIKEGESRTEYLENIGIGPAPGLILKLGKIRTGANYTCVVYDSRESVRNGEQRRMVTRFTVEVNVAQKRYQTCSEEVVDLIVWPRTMKNKQAVIPCSLYNVAEGTMRLGCKPTSSPRRSQWSRGTKDESQCVRKTFVKHANEIRRLFKGYVVNPGDYIFPYVYLMGVVNTSVSTPPSDAEWQQNMELIGDIIEYLRSKRSLPLVNETLASSFYGRTVPWLSGIGGDGYLKTRRVVEVFRLFNDSVALFGSRGEIVMKKPEISVVLTKNLNKSFITKIKDVTVNISLKDRRWDLHAEDFYGAGHFQELENALSHPEIYPSLSYVRNSSLVTVFQNENRSESAKVPIAVTIRFHKFIFPENLTHSLNLTCGRVNISSSRWIREEKDCSLSWHEEGLTCICSRSGTFALVRSEYNYMDDAIGGFRKTDITVPICCAVSFTMCIFAFIFLVRLVHDKQGSRVAFIKAHITIMSACVMLVIFLAVAKVFRDDFDSYLNGFLQFLFLSAISWEIALVVNGHIQISYGHKKTVGRVNIRLLFLAIEVTPGLFSILCVTLLSNEPNPWFLNKNGTQFLAFVVLNSFLCFVYISYYFFLLKLSTSAARKGCKSFDTVKHSIWTMASLILVETSVVLYVNQVSKVYAKYYLGAPCLAIGVVLFVCFTSNNCSPYKDATLSGMMMPKIKSLHEDKSSPDDGQMKEQVHNFTQRKDVNEDVERSCLLNHHHERWNRESSFVVASPSDDVCRFFKQRDPLITNPSSCCNGDLLTSTKRYNCKSCGRNGPDHLNVHLSPIPRRKLLEDESFWHENDVGQLSEYVGPETRYMPMNRVRENNENFRSAPIATRRGRQTSTGNESNGPTSSEPDSVEGQDSFDDTVMVGSFEGQDQPQRSCGSSFNRIHLVQSLPVLRTVENL